MRVIDNIATLREVRQSLSGSVGLVPTMGALHEGHLSLVRYGREENDNLIATIFVNPTQFSPDEDLDAYPRDLDGDLSKFEAEGVDYVFTPTPTLMYPQGYQTYVLVEHVTQGLESSQRPEHFRGVTTVVSKLFNLIQPTIAYFGQKDAQQAVVIRRMVADLNMPLQVAICPIVRENDGLAMSSRNMYLSADERQSARVLNRALQSAGSVYDAGQRNPDKLRAVMNSVLADEPLATVDYVSIADAKTLHELDNPTDAPMLLSLAVQIGKPRLLDNCLLPLSLNTREGLSATLGAVE